MLASDPTITIPWWDWTSEASRQEGIPRAYSDSTIDGRPNSLFLYHVELSQTTDLSGFTAQTRCPKSLKFDTHREPGLPFAPALPRADEVNEVLSRRDYGDFSDGMEDIHNRVHGYVGGLCGDMSHVPFGSF